MRYLRRKAVDAGKQLTLSAMAWLYVTVGGMLFLGGCRMPGRPAVTSLWRPPESNLDFHSLYATNCIACHADRRGVISPVINLNNSTYLSLIAPERMYQVIADGVPGTAMPAFSEKRGGRLTEAQINVLVKGIYAWASPGETSQSLPAYTAPLGNAEHGATVFSTYCARCHVGDTRTKVWGSITESSYLGLVSNQYLRTIIISGRPEVGHPNWKELSPMSAQDVSDVVAWMAKER
ncbi:MAG: c-type cytochrome [Candidatus Xiphinematobacter sp.]|nr:MAG: c-type cytochrome [Candidatus Xiphinematobacter sp.]